MTDSHDDLLQRFTQGDRGALAKILTLAEQQRAPAIPAELQHKPLKIVGITGSGGAGKSTLIAALVEYLRSKSLRVAVLACDPNSPITGGALLGDRIRMKLRPDDDGVFFRSLSTRGAAGGVSTAIGPMLTWVRAFGFDVAIVETVGVGQDQIGVRPLVDTLVLVVSPHTGDEVQWEKAGILEVADVVVVSKSDLTGAENVAGQLRRALTLGSDGKEVPVVSVSAMEGKGIEEMWNSIV